YVMTSNGYVAVNVLNATHRRDAYLYMGMDAEAANPSISTDTAARNAAVAEMQKKMDAWAADKTREAILEFGQVMRIPIGIPYTLSEVVHEDHFQQRGFFRPLETNAGVVQQPVGPYGAAPVRDDWKDAPALGEHTAEVLEQWLQIDRDDLVSESEN